MESDPEYYPRYLLVDYFRKRDLVFHGWDLPIQECSHNNSPHEHTLQSEDNNELCIYLSGNKETVKNLVQTENLNLTFNKYSDIVLCNHNQEEFLFREQRWESLRGKSRNEIMAVVELRESWKKHVVEKYESTDNKLEKHQHRINTNESDRYDLTLEQLGFAKHIG